MNTIHLFDEGGTDGQTLKPVPPRRCDSDTVIIMSTSVCIIFGAHPTRILHYSRSYHNVAV